MDVTTHPQDQRDEIAKRVRDLVPLLRANAPWQEEHRRLHDESVEALAAAGVFRLRVPARYGGYECDTRTLVDVAIELGRGDGAIAFTAALWWITTWNVGMFPDEVQDEVYATPDVRVCGTLAPTATATPVKGGIRVTGRWGFNSGAAHSHWKMLAALLPTADGGQEPVMALAPMGDVRVVDDWHTAGLRGTGSVTVTAEDLFIPEGRYLPIMPLLRQQYASKLNADSPSYRVPMIGAISASTTGKLVGLARGAWEAFFERLPGRGITYTSYTSQAEAPVTHLTVAEARLKIDEAEFHARRLATMVDEKGLADEPWTWEERAYARVAVSRACRLAKEAVDALTMASGGSAIYDAVPLQRIQRDVQAITMHALNLPETNLELYGRVLCGLEPNTPYI